MPDSDDIRMSEEEMAEKEDTTERDVSKQGEEENERRSEGR